MAYPPPVHRRCTFCQHSHYCSGVEPKKALSGYQCGWCHQRHASLDDVKTCRFNNRVRTKAEMEALGRDLLSMRKELP